MVKDPQRVAEFLTTGRDPDTGEHPLAYVLDHPPGAWYCYYIEINRHDNIGRYPASDRHLIYRRFGESVVDAIRGSGHEPTDELVNEVVKLVVERVESDYRELYLPELEPDIPFPPRPIYRDVERQFPRSAQQLVS